MITPNVEERLETVVELLKKWRISKQEFLPVLYTDNVYDKQTIPVGYDGWQTFAAPYTVYEKEKYYWFKASFEINREYPQQKAYFCLDTHIVGVASTIRPQGLLYLNGELVQGIDINHGDVLLEDGKYEMYLLFYTHTFDRYLPLDFSLKYVDERIDGLYYDLLIPLQAVKLLAKSSNEYVASASLLEKALNRLDVREVYSDDFYASVEEVRNFLKREYYGGVCGSKQTVACIGHTHIDVAWMWDLEQTKQKVERSFSTVLKLMDEYPEYKFFSSQPQLFDFLKERNPELYGRVKEKILEGRWEVDGGMWLEADCNLTSGESLVRQITYGKRFFKEEFGKECETVWLPDVFGYSASLPQIMQKSGLKNFVTAKIGWNDTNRMPYDAFMWRGIDGSEIFAYFLSTCECDPRNGIYDHTYTTYTAPITPMYVLGTWNRFQQKDFSDTVIMSYGWGDGGGGPTREDIEFERRLQGGLPGIPKTKIETLENSLRTIRENYEKNAEELQRKPVWNGELYFEYHRGTLSSVPQVKMNNRKGEFALMNAELFGVLGSLLCNKKYPEALLRKNWKLLLLNQFHDILPGSSIGDVYKDSNAQFEEIFADTDCVIDCVLETVASQVKTDGGLLVFNPNGFMADGTVTVNGNTYIAKDIPAFGYKVVQKENADSNVKVSANTLENSYYKLTFDKSGAICSLIDKRVGRELVKSGRLLNQMVVFQDTPYQYDNWEMTPYHKQNKWLLDAEAEFQTLLEGDRAGFAIKKRYGNSVITQKVYLYEDGIDRIDFVTDVDWKEKNQLLKTVFPFDVMADKASYDIQFGHVERAMHDNTSWDSARFESAAQKWVDVSENDYGVALLNDGKYGFGVDNGELSMTILKSGSFPFDGASDIVPTFVYSLLPHKARACDGGVVEKSYVLNRPFFVKELQKNENGRLPTEWSLLHCETKGVMIETVKRSESGDGIVIRMYEAYKERKTVKLSVPNLKEAVLCDLNETETKKLQVDGNTVTFDIKPFEIMTIKVIL
ncbi:MAG: alpha-mannosidase [Clostridia bacterium]|nr:alpha-mannosidase [Clostridia bacterium]